MREKKQHPMQPIVLDVNENPRFQENAIVRHLIDNGSIDLNDLARLPFSVEDREQLAQLIGYSVGGFGELSYVRDATVRKADKEAAKLLKKKP